MRDEPCSVRLRPIDWMKRMFTFTGPSPWNAEESDRRAELDPAQQ